MYNCVNRIIEEWPALVDYFTVEEYAEKVKKLNATPIKNVNSSDKKKG